MPENVLAILLGAASFPLCGSLTSSKAFAESKRRFHNWLVAERGFALPADNCLDLFDRDLSQDDHYKEISRFLDQRLAASASVPIDALIVFYVGHGAFSAQDYYLATRRTWGENAGASSLVLKNLVRVFDSRVSSLKTFFFIDACFSAETAKHFQGADAQSAYSQSVRNGVSLFCSSSSSSVSFLLPGESASAFTSGLVAALTRMPLLPNRASLRKLAARTWNCMQIEADHLRELWPRDDKDSPYLYEPVKPEVHSPRQGGGDLADDPFFFRTFSADSKVEMEIENPMDALNLSAYALLDWLNVKKPKYD